MKKWQIIVTIVILSAWAITATLYAVFPTKKDMELLQKHSELNQEYNKQNDELWELVKKHSQLEIEYEKIEEEHLKSKDYYLKGLAYEILFNMMRTVLIEGQDYDINVAYAEIMLREGLSMEEMSIVLNYVNQNFPNIDAKP